MKPGKYSLAQKGMHHAMTVLVLIFAQLFGQRVMWQALMGDNYERLVKTATQETCELVGYLFIDSVVLGWTEEDAKKARKISDTVQETNK